jgi:hypothetical protein
MLRKWRFLALAELMFSTGTWTVTAVSNILKRKTAADAAPVVRFLVRPEPTIPHGWLRAVRAVETPYTVTTAALDAAPTAVVRRITLHETTGVLSTETLTESEIIRGTNSTGTAEGDYIHRIAFADPINLLDNQYLQVEVTFDAAATTVLDIGAPRVEYAG